MIGERVNNYQIISLLGEGGMGAVYLAEHPFMGRKAAIKVLRREFAEDRGLVERFMNEARAANAIRHANIIDIIDVGQLPSGIPFLMMEFLDGESLAARVARLGKLEVGEAVDIVAQTATALAAAHAKGIVHRDLKPDNLFLLPDDSRAGGLRVKVLDFGIAKLRGDLTGSGAKTQSGSLMGTPPYMSPEQCRGLPDEIDERTDIYALGIILYELLCGAPPFVSAGWGDIVLMHITQPPPPPRGRNPAIPPALEAVILKALAKERVDRFVSMRELQVALRVAIEGVPTSASGGAWAVSGDMARHQTVSATPAPRSVGTPSSVPATTTFRTGTGEVVSSVARLSTSGAAPSSGGRSGRRPVTVAGGVLAAVALSVLVLVVLRKRDPAPSVPPVPVASPAGAASQRPGAGAPVAAAASADSTVVREANPPAATPARHSIRLASQPAGARIIDTRSGAVIGTTPVAALPNDSEKSLELRLSKEGFADVLVSFPPRQDVERTVVLETARDGAGARNRRAGPRESQNRRSTAGRVEGVTSAGASPSVPTGTTTKPKATAEKW